jgi:type IV secretory pathway VirB4 component
MVKVFGGKVISINSSNTSSINPFNIGSIDEKKEANKQAVDRTLQFVKFHLQEFSLGDELTQHEENIIVKFITENDNSERTTENIYKEILKQKQNGVTGLSRLIAVYEEILNK